MMIQLLNLTKSFPDGENRQKEVLCGINMEVKKGEFIAITGASASGKTTLLSVLGTLVSADSGSYLLDGKEMVATNVDVARVRNATLGFVFQDHRLLPQYTVWDNILLPILAYASKVTDVQAQYAQELMEMTGISALASHYPATLSGGEASRVALCRALIMKPLLLLADEPTGQLDVENARNIVSLLTKVNKELGTTIIMVTHSQETAAAAQRVLILKDGKIE
ncbi:lipoprotein-releasing system ATP-binding protein LolD [Bacteroidia bacterium]|nr:lipoprotein-releasing system ATP-binding protein LolD [Bacteroidia bacterium]